MQGKQLRINDTTANFIKTHRNDRDIRSLALRAAGQPDIDLPFALDQIAGRQAAQRKLPSWAATDGIIYPPHLSMEQCSSEQAALYKAGVAARVTDGASLVDITGGFGVDFSFMAGRFRRAVYVERQAALCDIAGQNLRLLGLRHTEVVNGDGIDYLRGMTGRVSLIFADPARRDDKGGRTFAISDCTPDVLASMDMMLDKAGCVMLKLSPMLDWRKAVQDIGPAVREVHIVSVGGECKELLMVVKALQSPTAPLNPPKGGRSVAASPQNQIITVVAVDLAATVNEDMTHTAAANEDLVGTHSCICPQITDGQKDDSRTDTRMCPYSVGSTFSFHVSADTLQIIAPAPSPTLHPPFGGTEGGSPTPSPTLHPPFWGTEGGSPLPSPTLHPPLGGLRGASLYEPNASIMKAGCFSLLEQRYGVRQIAHDSHLFVSGAPVSDFPGRRFIINNVTTLNKRELRTALAGITKANIAVRNFPMTVAELRKRLRLSDGGGTYIFATTLADKSRVLLVCSKVS